MQTLAEIWAEILHWASSHAPKLQSSIRSGATTSEIAEAERRLGVQLPADIAESYLLHDGQNVDEYDGSVVGFIDGCELLSLRRMVQHWSGWKEGLDRGDFLGISSKPKGPVKPDWWNTKWVPITFNGFGDNACIDFDPPPNGKIGQIIQVWHDQSVRVVLAPSFHSWLHQFILDLRSGEYVYSDEHGGLVRIGDLDAEE